MPKTKFVNINNCISSCLTKRSVSDREICAYIQNKSENSPLSIDEDGRSALHMAASCGRLEVAKWLINCKNANINLKDRESGYTPLHRSIYYGQLHVASYLLRKGCDLTAKDNDNLTVIEHAIKDRIEIAEKTKYNEIYVWGMNLNNTLGTCSQQILHPEHFEVIDKKESLLSIKQIQLSKYHILILTQNGEVYSCGHGTGGRLGLGDEKVSLIPTRVRFKGSNISENVKCEQVSISNDHSLFLLSNGTVWSCGLNVFHTLGYKQHSTFVPTKISSLSMIEGINAAKFHSLAWHSNRLYVWGINGGQLGMKSTSNNNGIIYIPKEIESNLNDLKTIEEVISNDYTIVFRTKEFIYLSQNYMCRKIVNLDKLRIAYRKKLDKHIEIVKMLVLGGEFDTSVNNLLQKETLKLQKLKIFLMTNNGSILLLSQDQSNNQMYIHHCLFNINRNFNVIDMALSEKKILFVTNEGEVFHGDLKRIKIQQLNGHKSNSHKHKLLSPEQNIFNNLTSLIIYKLNYIHRGENVFCDPRGDTYAVLQNNPNIFLNDYSKFCNMPSTFLTSFEKLFLEIESKNELHDSCFKLDNKYFYVHKYIIACNCQYLYNLIKNKDTVELKNIHPTIFKEILLYIYTRKCKFLTEGKLQKDNELSSTKQWEMFSTYAKQFSLINLCAQLENFHLSKDGNYMKKKKTEINRCNNNSFVFDINQFPELYDVQIKCTNNTLISAHKCILSSRFDYFNNVFSLRWNSNPTNTKQMTQITLQCNDEVVKILLNYIYSDNLNLIIKRLNDLDLVCNLIEISDELFITPLKEACEYLLIKKISLINILQLAQFAKYFNCHILKKYCYKFICYNLSLLLEKLTIRMFSDDILIEISEFYKDLNPKFKYRIITPYSSAESDDIIKAINESNPIKWDEIEKEKIKIKTKSKSTKSGEKFKRKSPKVNLDEVYLDVIKEENPKRKPSKINLNEVYLDIMKEETPCEQKLKEDIDDEGFTTKQKKIKNSLNKNLICSLKSNGLNCDKFLDAKDENKKELNKNNKVPEYVPFSCGYDSNYTFGNVFEKLLKSKNLDLGPSAKTMLIPPPPKGGFNPWKFDQFSDCCLPGNPWKTIDEMNVDKLIQFDSFSSIVNKQRQEKEKIAKIRAKSLTLTQVEDRAIEDLKKFYNIDVVYDENISVERVLEQNLGDLIWVKK